MVIISIRSVMLQKVMLPWVRKDFHGILKRETFLNKLKHSELDSWQGCPFLKIRPPWRTSALHTFKKLEKEVENHGLWYPVFISLYLETSTQRLIQVVYDGVNIYFLPYPLLTYSTSCTSFHSPQHWEWPNELLDIKKVNKHEWCSRLFSFLFPFCPLPGKDHALFPDWETVGSDLKPTCNLKQSYPANPNMPEWG